MESLGHNYVLLGVLQPIGLLFEDVQFVVLVLPEVGGEVFVGLLQRVEQGLSAVQLRPRGTGGLREKVLDAGLLDNLSRRGGRDDTATTGSGDDFHEDRAAFASELAGQGVGFAAGGSPVASTDRDHVKLSRNDGAPDGQGDFLGGFLAKADVAILVSDHNSGTETGPLTGIGLLLHGLHVDDFIFEIVLKEFVDDLVLLDGDSPQVDVFERDFVGFD